MNGKRLPFFLEIADDLSPWVISEAPNPAHVIRVVIPLAGGDEGMVHTKWLSILIDLHGFFKTEVGRLSAGLPHRHCLHLTLGWG